MKQTSLLILAFIAMQSCLSAWADPATIQPGEPEGHEFLVNTTTEGAQISPSVAMGPGGASVVVWTGQNPGNLGFDIYGQRYDATGKALGGEFRVSNLNNKFSSMTPVVGMDARGNFAVAWSGNEIGIGTIFIEDIFARQYDAAGNPAGNAFRVNSLHEGYSRNPAIAMSQSGNFVISWHNVIENEIFARLFGPDGAPAGRDFQVNSFFVLIQSYSAVAMDADGNFVVVWQSLNQDAPCANLAVENCYGIYGQRFNAFGNAVGSEFQVNTQEIGNQFSPAIAMDLHGNFVVAWASNPVQSSSLPYPCKDSDIFAQRFDNSGNPLGSEFQVNTYSFGDQCNPAIAIDTEKNFVVTWDSYDPNLGLGFEIYGQRFDSAGLPLGKEFRANNYSKDDQSASSVAMDADGDLLISWHSLFQTGDYNSYGIVARRYHGMGRTVDLNLTLLDNPDPVVSGSNLTYTVSTSNLGTGAAVGLELNIQLPADTLFYSYKSANWKCRNVLITVTCTLTELPAGHNSQIEIATATMVSLKATSLTTTATVLAAQSDDDVSDNSVTISTEVQAAGALPSDATDGGSSTEDSFQGGGGALSWWLLVTMLVALSMCHSGRARRLRTYNTI